MNPYTKITVGLLAAPLALSLTLPPLLNPSPADAAGSQAPKRVFVMPTEKPAPPATQQVLKDGAIQTLHVETYKPAVKSVRVYSGWKANKPATIRIALDEQNVSPEKPQYTVQSGDTVWALAKAIQSTVQKIAGDNHLENPDRIYVDQRLTTKSGNTPAKTETAEASTDTTTVMANGQTLTVKN